jgi:hypothetical protein
MLFFHHGPLSLTYESFLQDCHRLIEKSAFEQIRQAKLNSNKYLNTRNTTFYKWQKTYFALQNELVRLRAKKLTVSPHNSLRLQYTDSSYAKQIEEAVDEYSPLRAEHHLMELQWRILEDLQTGHQFDLDFLFIYSLKLQLLERKATFNFESGKRIFESIIYGSEKIE